MARKLELNHDQARILTSRVLLSRSLGLFTLRELTTGWGISLATLHRYKSPEYRARSREHARRAYLSYRESLLHGICYRCREELTEHARCADCTILMHTGTRFCDSCFATREHRTMEGYHSLIQLV